MTNSTLPDERRAYTRVPFSGGSIVNIGDQKVSAAQIDVSVAGTLLELNGSHQLSIGGIYDLSMIFSDRAPCEQFDFRAEMVHQAGNRVGFRFQRMPIEAFSYLCNVLLYRCGDDDLVEEERRKFLHGQSFIQD